MGVERTRVIEAGESMLAAGAGVLSEAFREEPLTAFIFDLSNKSAPRILRRVHLLSARIYFNSGQKIFLALQGGAVIGIAVLTKEGKLPVLKAAARELPGILSILPRVFAIISLGKLLRVKSLAAVPRDLPRPFCSLDAIAVDSGFRGMGIGGMLLEEVRRAAEKNPGITGVYLITLTEKNKLLYERHGFQTMEERRLGGLKAYHMFRRNSSRNPGLVRGAGRTARPGPDSLPCFFYGKQVQEP